MNIVWLRKLTTKKARRLALLVPFLCVLLGRSCAADRLGDAAVARAAAVSRDLGCSPAEPKAGDDEGHAGHELTEQGTDAGASNPSKRHSKGKPPPPPVAVEQPAADGGAKTLYLHIPAPVVRRAFSPPRGSADPAVDASGHPVGVRLSGVGGTGLQDGDIVTHVDGAPVTTVEGGVAIVAAALQRHQRHISGRVLRGGSVVLVTVDVPEEAMKFGQKP